MGRPRSCSCDECPKCKHRIYMKDYYQRNRATYVNVEKRRAYDRRRYHEDAEYRKKHAARMVAAQRVRRGTVEKGRCAMCGNPNTVGHHNDYDKPFEVTWLCSSCHELVHNALPIF